MRTVVADAVGPSSLPATTHACGAPGARELARTARTRSSRSSSDSRSQAPSSAWISARNSIALLPCRRRSDVYRYDERVAANRHEAFRAARRSSGSSAPHGGCTPPTGTIAEARDACVPALCRMCVARRLRCCDARGCRVARGESLGPRRRRSWATAVQSVATIRSSSVRAAALSRSSLRLPHFGLCTHDGHPARHGHRSSSRAVSRDPVGEAVEAALGDPDAARVALVDEDRRQAGLLVDVRREPADVPAVAHREERQQRDQRVLGGVERRDERRHHVDPVAAGSRPGRTRRPPSRTSSRGARAASCRSRCRRRSPCAGTRRPARRPRSGRGGARRRRPARRGATRRSRSSSPCAPACTSRPRPAGRAPLALRGRAT